MFSHDQEARIIISPMNIHGNRSVILTQFSWNIYSLHHQETEAMKNEKACSVDMNEEMGIGVHMSKTI